MVLFNIEVRKDNRRWMAFTMPKNVSTCKSFIKRHMKATNNTCTYIKRLSHDKPKITNRYYKCIAATKENSQHQRCIKSSELYREIA